MTPHQTHLIPSANGVTYSSPGGFAATLSCKGRGVEVRVSHTVCAPEYIILRQR